MTIGAAIPSAGAPMRTCHFDHPEPGYLARFSRWEAHSSRVIIEDTHTLAAWEHAGMMSNVAEDSSACRQDRLEMGDMFWNRASHKARLTSYLRSFDDDPARAKDNGGRISTPAEP